MRIREVITRMFGLGVATLIALSLAPAAHAQNGFPAAKAAVDQYEPPPPPPPPPNNNGNNGNNGNGNGNGNNGNNGNNGKPRPNRGNGNDGDKGDRPRCSRTSKKSRRSQTRCPAAGTGPDSDSGGPGGSGVRSERGGPLPLAEAQGGRLPFTGLDLLMVASLGALLLAAGFGVRAASRSRPPRG